MHTKQHIKFFELGVALTHNVPFTCHFHNLASCIGLTRDSNPISKRFYRFFFCVLLELMSSFYFIYFHLEMQKFIIIHVQLGLIIVVTYFYYIGQNNTSLGFVTFLLMSCVSLLFDN
jgi:uncharacterized membrane protein